MGKVLKVVAGVALIAAVALTGGLAAVPAGAWAGGLLGAGILTGGTLVAVGASLALGGIMQAMAKMPQSQLSRLNPSLDPSTPRKAVFGTTAMPTDIRYHESSGTDQEYIDYILACTAHEVASIDEIWFEEKKAWDASTGVTSTYSGYLTVNVRTEGTSGNYISINGGANWGSTRLLTGCSYVHIRIKRTGNSKKTESPLTSGLPGRVTIIGEGALLYDPRLDSTVPGGSGSHRADDQSTWGSYTDPDDTDNPALQLLWWMLGWKINDKLSIGCGVPPERIDLESFITAANICDETVTLATGGSQARYRTSGTATDADGRMDIINTFLACMNGTLRDSDGKLSLTVLKNDLAEYVLDMDDDDILDEFQWDQTRGLDTGYNKARGRYVDPSSYSLYQLSEYPEVGFDSIDGIERVLSLDLPYVEDGRRAQRIAKQVLQRNQYRGRFSCKSTAKAMGVKVGDVVRISFAPLGWSRKLFRIATHTINMDATVSMSMVEENPAIYAWDAEDSAPVTPTAPTVYDPLNNPFILGVTEAQTTAEGKITTFYETSAPTAEGDGDLWVDTDDNNKLYRWNGSIWQSVRDNGAEYALLGLNSNGTVANNKVVSSSLDDSVVQEIVFSSQTNITATDAGALLVMVEDVTAKPSQGGRVILSFTCDVEGQPSSGNTYVAGYAHLQRSAANANSWSSIGVWRMFYYGNHYQFIGYEDVPTDGDVTVTGGIAPLGFKEAAYRNLGKIGMGTANQWIDSPPSDGDYDYRILFCKTSVLGTTTLPEVGAALASGAELQALSIKVLS